MCSCLIRLFIKSSEKNSAICNVFTLLLRKNYFCSSCIIPWFKTVSYNYTRHVLFLYHWSILYFSRSICLLYAYWKIYVLFLLLSKKFKNIISFSFKKYLSICIISKLVLFLEVLSLINVGQLSLISFCLV